MYLIYTNSLFQELYFIGAYMCSHTRNNICSNKIITLAVRVSISLLVLLNIFQKAT